MTDNAFGEMMHRLMSERGTTLRSLSSTLNYDLGYLSKVSNGHKRPSPELALRLDHALNAAGKLVALAPRRARRGATFEGPRPARFRADIAANARELQQRLGLRPREAWRQAHGWTVHEAAARFTDLAAERGHDIPRTDAALLGKWEKWPAFVECRPTLVILILLADLYGCTLWELLDGKDRQHLPDADMRVLFPATWTPGDTDFGARPSASQAHWPTDDEPVRCAAEESARWAQWAESSNIGDVALEQLWADVRLLSADYLLHEPVTLFGRARALRDRLFALLEGHQPPTQAADLYIAAGYVCVLLAWMTSDLGNLAAADTHARTAWLCGERVGHDGLRAWVCSTRSKIAFWDERYSDAIAHARRGGTFRAPGTVAVLLACQEADAWADRGSDTDAQAALTHAADARDRLQGRDDIAGVLSCPPIRHANYAAAVHLRGGRPAQALAEADQAIATLPAHAYGTMAQLHIGRASSHLAAGDLDGLSHALKPVLELPPKLRLDPITRRVQGLSADLAHSAMASTRIGMEVQEQAKAFCLESAPSLALSPSHGTG
jgi:transcriptional regulator with XRE-family HTH domain